MKLKFSKYHGTGNDFIIFNNIEKKYNIKQLSVLSKEICQRHFSIGADGLIALELKENIPYMNYINSDGSIAEMCGNGIRCTAKYILDNDLFQFKNNKISINTGAGIKKISINIDENKFLATVNMGSTKEIKIDQSLTIDNQTFNFTFVSVGNPHSIIIVDEINDNLVLNYGPKIEKNIFFKNKTNVEFVKINSKEHINARVWERGCGETMACGSGATSIFAALHKKKLINNKATISMPGGNLILEIKETDIFLTGEAKLVFEGEILISF